jgi:hypothetical protein
MKPKFSATLGIALREGIEKGVESSLDKYFDFEAND